MTQDDFLILKMDISHKLCDKAHIRNKPCDIKYHVYGLFLFMGLCQWISIPWKSQNSNLKTKYACFQLARSQCCKQKRVLNHLFSINWFSTIKLAEYPRCYVIQDDSSFDKDDIISSSIIWIPLRPLSQLCHGRPFK